jgi:hypothetical protein
LAFEKLGRKTRPRTDVVASCCQAAGHNLVHRG